MCVKIGCALAVEIVYDNEKERMWYILNSIDKYRCNLWQQKRGTRESIV